MLVLCLMEKALPFILKKVRFFMELHCSYQQRSSFFSIQSPHFSIPFLFQFQLFFLNFILVLFLKSSRLFLNQPNQIDHIGQLLHDLISNSSQTRSGVKRVFLSISSFFSKFVLKLLLMVAQVVFGPTKSTQIVFGLSKSTESR